MHFITGLALAVATAPPVVQFYVAGVATVATIVLAKKIYQVMMPILGKMFCAISEKIGLTHFIDHYIYNECPHKGGTKLPTLT
jgi:hypothetical protein